MCSQSGRELLDVFRSKASLLTYYGALGPDDRVICGLKGFLKELTNFGAGAVRSVGARPVGQVTAQHHKHGEDRAQADCSH